MRLDGQIAIVTGGGRGIGRAVALGLAREGADVTAAGYDYPIRQAHQVDGLGVAAGDLDEVWLAR